MAGPIYADRVKQTTTTTGTGTLNFDATVPSAHISFVSGVGTGNTCFYCIAHQTSNEWEVGIGTVTSGSPDTLSRTTIVASSNSGSATSFSSGTKDVFVTSAAIYGVTLTGIVTTLALQRVGQTLLSSTAGNARGTGAVDLQVRRTLATQSATGNYSLIGGGQKNIASGSNSTCTGGSTNTASGTDSTVAGGRSNTASGTDSTIGGGLGNSCTQSYTICAGGYNNTVSGKYGVICGGYHNTASGQNSFIGGGDHNTANTNYASVVGGIRGVARLYGQRAQASGRFSADGDAQTSELVLRKQTTSATQAEMFLNSSSLQMVMSNDTTWAFNVIIVARRTDADGESAAYLVTGAIDRNTNAASTALVAAITKTVIAEDNAAWDVDVNADTSTGALRIQVTGETSKTINWVAFVRLVETTG